jgi:hypothetical protein
MEVKWLVEDDAFPEDTQSFLDAVKNSGHEYKIIKQRPYDPLFDFYSLFPKEDCVVFYGSLGLAKQIRKKCNWIPGVYYDPPKYNCTAYYAELGRYLVNGNYIMLPFGELIRRKEYIFEHLSDNRAVFVRPDRGDKVFTGKVVYKEHWEKDIDYFNFNQLDKKELVIVAEPRNIVFEWRFVIVEGKVINGSQYRENEIVGNDSSYPHEAAKLAEEVASIYNPEPAFVVDVCLTKSGEYCVMEIGCFSCAGLYSCDRMAVVKAVSDVALKEWLDINEI